MHFFLRDGFRKYILYRFDCKYLSTVDTKKKEDYLSIRKTEIQPDRAIIT